MAEPRPLTLGTAGHIDHGKTALVEALSGTNTDRLAEERRRGISIELGFARLGLPNGRSLSIVDVPGHERLVRTMVAGATGIDLFLLVVAVDDGVMPQTREHVAVLRALGVERGVVVLTKCDLVEEALRARVREQVLKLLPGAPVVETSVRTGDGLGSLLSTVASLADLSDRQRGRSEGTGWPQPSVLHVDRAFTLHGIGTVVTGTLRGGTITRGERVEILPRKLEVRVRKLHVHDRSVEAAAPGQRVALNLAGVRRSDVERGDVVATQGSELAPSYRLDVELRLEPRTEDLDGERVQIHHGTRNAPARLRYLDDERRFAQLRLESQLLAHPGDRLVIRRVAPADTLGGGEVVDPRPGRHGRGAAAARLRLIVDGSPRDLLRMAVEKGQVPADPRRWLECRALAPALRRHPRSAWEQAAASLRGDGSVVERAGSLHSPRSSAAEAPRLPEPDRALGDLEVATLELLRADGIAPRSPQALADALAVGREEAISMLDRLARTSSVRCVKPGLYYETSELGRLRDRVIASARERGGSISVAELRDALATSRRYAQALLEHLDSEKVMVRLGERHHLRQERTAQLRPAVGRQGSGGPPGLQSQ